MLGKCLINVSGIAQEKKERKRKSIIAQEKKKEKESKKFPL